MATPTIIQPPDFAFRSIADIDFEYLSSLGIKRYLFDLDGALVPWLRMYLNPRFIAKLREAKANGWIEDACVFSNAGLPPFNLRVTHIAKKLGLKWHVCYIYTAMKPSLDAFEAALSKINGSPQDTAIIGDQLGKDIAGGKAAGIWTILVESLRCPIGKLYLQSNAHMIRELGIEFSGVVLERPDCERKD